MVPIRGACGEALGVGAVFCDPGLGATSSTCAEVGTPNTRLLPTSGHLGAALVAHADVTRVATIATNHEVGPFAVGSAACPACAGRARRGALYTLTARREEESRRREAGQYDQDGAHRFLEPSGATTDCHRDGGDRGAARDAARWRTRARKVRRRSGGLAPERLPGNRDVETGRFRRADLELRYRLSATCQIVTTVDRYLRFTYAARRCAATTRRALAIILNSVVENVPLSKHVSRIGGTFAFAFMEDAQGKALGNDVSRQTP